MTIHRGHPRALHRVDDEVVASVGADDTFRLVIGGTGSITRQVNGVAIEDLLFGEDFGSEGGDDVEGVIFNEAVTASGSSYGQLNECI